MAKRVNRETVVYGEMLVFKGQGGMMVLMVRMAKMERKVLLGQGD
jgi:hypothetical protein